MLVERVDKERMRIDAEGKANQHLSAAGPARSVYIGITDESHPRRQHQDQATGAIITGGINQSAGQQRSLTGLNAGHAAPGTQR